MSAGEQANPGDSPAAAEQQQQPAADRGHRTNGENDDGAGGATGAKPSDQADEGEHRDNERALVRWTRAVALLTAGLIVVSAITGAIFYKQLNVMQGQLDAMERDQRPYVFISDKVDPPHLNASNEVVWTWSFVNSGKGNATDVRIDHYLRLGQQARFVRNAGFAAGAFVGELGAGSSNYLSTYSRPIDPGTFKALESANLEISLYAEFRYADAAGKTYLKAVCAGRLANGAVARLNPADCEKQAQR